MWKRGILSFFAIIQVIGRIMSVPLLPPTLYVLRYDYVPDVLEKRGPYREGHLGLAKQMIQDGKCVVGGPFAETASPSNPTGAYFLFTSAEAAQEFADKDPYGSGGIVTKYSIVEWSVALQKEN